jgi:hypothetical protein
MQLHAAPFASQMTSCELDRSLQTAASAGPAPPLAAAATRTDPLTGPSMSYFLVVACFYTLDTFEYLIRVRLYRHAVGAVNGEDKDTNTTATAENQASYKCRLKSLGMLRRVLSAHDHPSGQSCC